MTRRGLFISFEGIDGCGKTTQIQLLARRLRQLGVRPVLAQEPGGTAVGRLIRGVLLDSANEGIDSRTELLLYFASRAQNLAEVIMPALEDGQVVISDRFTDATVAYQGYGSGLGRELVLQLSAAVCNSIQPDLTLWLDLDPETSRSRARCRNQARLIDEGRMEAQSLEFFARVRQGYASIHASEPERVQCIDAGGSCDAVAERVLAAVLPAVSALPGPEGRETCLSQS